MKIVRVMLMLLVACLLVTLTTVQLWAGTTGTLSGTVTDSSTKAPLSGANIVVKGTNLSTVTDAAGRFVIINVAPGEYSVAVELVGYGTQIIDSIPVSMDTVAVVDFGLGQEAIAEQDVVVVRARPMIETGAVNTLNQVTALQEPLTRLDAASIHTGPGVLSALPGVLVEADGSGQMHLRGGKPDQIGWYVEGIPLTDPNNGMFGTNLYTTGLSKFQMYTGGFGAEYGNAISGVLNEVKKTGALSPGLRMNVESGSDTYRSSLTEFGGGTAETFNYYVGSNMLQSDLDAPQVKRVEYADNTVKMVWPLKRDSITLLGLQGSQYGELEQEHTIGIHGEADVNGKDSMRTRYYVLGATWNHTFSPRSFMLVQPYYQYTTAVGNSMGGSIGMQGWDTWSVRHGLQLKYTSQLNDANSLKLGGSILRGYNNYYVNSPGFAEFHADVPTIQTDFYAEDQLQLSEKWTVAPGLRYESMRYNRGGREYVAGAGYSGAVIPDISESSVSPRFGTSYAPNDRTSWRLSWGKYTKFVPANAVEMRFTDPDFGPYGPEGPTVEQMMPSLGATSPQRSTNLELAYEKQQTDTMAWRVSCFSNKYKNLLDQSLVGGTYAWTNLGEGESKGIEFLLRKKMSEKWQGWFAYTYQKAEANRADLGLNDSMFTTPWDQRHTFALVANYKNGDWAHSLRADLGSGRQGKGSPDAVRRADAYAILTYNLSFAAPKGWGIGESIYLNIYNVLDSRETMQWSSDGSGGQDRYAWVPSRFISLGVSRSY